MTIPKTVISVIMLIALIIVVIVMILIIVIILQDGWISVCSWILYELDHRKPILYVIPIQTILGKLPVVPAGDTGTIPHHLRNGFPGAPGDSKRRLGDGCRMWFVNSWVLGWSRDL
jgi:hypothetical protein